jgi:hypothetical protein
LPLFTSLLCKPQRYALNDNHDLPESHHFSEGATERWMGVVKNTIMKSETTDLVEMVERLHSSNKGRHRLFRSEIGYNQGIRSPCSEKVCPIPLSFLNCDLDEDSSSLRYNSATESSSTADSNKSRCAFKALENIFSKSSGHNEKNQDKVSK